MRSLLNIKSPIVGGNVVNWDAMEDLWHYTFYKGLRVAPEEHPILLNKPLLSPRPQNEKTAQILMETFQFPALYIADQVLLSLFSSGQTTGLVVDIGKDLCQIAPIYESTTVPFISSKLKLAGNDITEYLTQLLMESGSHRFSTSAEKELVHDMKEKHCYVAYDFEDELQKATCKGALEKFYQLPNGKVIPMNTERFTCTEMLFQPDFAGKDYEYGIQGFIFNAVRKSNVEQHKDLWYNIVVSGGTTQLPGFSARLKKELVPYVGKFSPRTRNTGKYGVWFGGSQIAGNIHRGSIWFTKEEYDEAGFSMLHKRCR